MKENLLQFIWKLQMFSYKDLCCTNGTSILVIANGNQNFNSGPDFLNAKIVIGDQFWAGNVEIHVNASDWYVHNHEIDENYDAVILHVVWNNDTPIFGKSNQEIPTLELKNYISKEVLSNYEDLFNTDKNWINCEKSINEVDSFQMSNWFERLYFERLEQKSAQVQKILNKTNNNWEATLFMLLAKSFGLKINSEAFFNFASSFDFSIVRKVSNNQLQLEALFFGQAGLLSEEYESVYYENLKSEYEYLKLKFNLKPISKGQIQFFRLRPYNFPTIRLSQLASLYHLHQNLFSKLMELKSIEDFYKFLAISTSTFWETHYTFEKESKKSTKKLSKSFVDLILVNTIVPLKFMYLKSLDKDDFTPVLAIVEAIKPEENSIISKFVDCEIQPKNALETQALLQLKNEYCNKQLCLECVVGKEVLIQN